MVQNWRLHKALAFIGMAFAAGVLLNIKGIQATEMLFNAVPFRWVAILGIGYAAWVFHSLVKI